MFFDTSGIEVSPWIPLLVAFCISFFTSTGSFSGAFLLPFQMSFLGYTNPYVSATNQLYNIVAIPSGVYRFYRKWRMVWPLTWAVVIGTLTGVFIGAVVRVVWLPDLNDFKAFTAFVLLYMGVRLATAPQALPGVHVTRFDMKRIGYDFYGKKYEAPTFGIFGLSFIVGIVAEYMERDAGLVFGKS